ncbi:MAG: RNA polymerase, sigma-24 subunit, ECF subfamily [Candidatus Magasanikbacteria bacterium GW2011_GWC2_37_14]|uniref:RNA polymerase, sigma-24 subunit, ECF subfamily n=1 Tax=Candidatus Magasanikbacteria bacterium GW2011_GWC2_37_14 TaxID=1619046 RepID=A0A0G0G756_9BACT|nr:MAG: RNA polymerase, sigma-24 subunit, ECF subfamily [Candidatus Magasanikbacteria bacterium GW2011_GWC2_37_14]
MDIEIEKEQIAKAQQDKKEFAPIYTVYYQKILSYIIKRTNCVQVAEDITSTVFLKAMISIKKFKCTEFGISPWLFKIAVNELNDFYRKKKCVSLDQLMEDANFEPENFGDHLTEVRLTQEKIDNDIKGGLIRKELQKLSIKYQDVISLKYFENKTIEEICLILDKKEGTVKSLISRGLKKLKKNFKLTKDINKDEKEVQPFATKNVILLEQS